MFSLLSLLHLNTIALLPVSYNCNLFFQLHLTIILTYLLVCPDRYYSNFKFPKHMFFFIMYLLFTFTSLLLLLTFFTFSLLFDRKWTKYVHFRSKRLIYSICAFTYQHIHYSSQTIILAPRSVHAEQALHEPIVAYIVCLPSSHL